MGLLKGKTAVVTGAGRGIGGAIARGLGQEGANVVLVSRTREQLEEQAEIIEGYGVETLIVPADVASEADVKKVVDEAVKRFGSVDILVNAAGITMVSKSEELSLENWFKCININLTGTFLMCREVGRVMIEQGKGGKIVNITSLVAHTGIQQRAAYSSSKGGVMQLTQALAAEWGRYNIQVNNISPGYIITEMVQELIDRGVHNPDLMAKRTPAGRMGQVDDLVGPAVFLCSSMSDFVTGHTLIVDGGWLSNGHLDLY
ncbi:MAG: glucose 1-dehydrogenase [Candidatus Wallacebacter cryptica]|nr:glucose 1-dehydrogenase [Bacillota bacterium]